VDGNGAGSVAGLGGTVVADWAPGQTLWLRWVDLNDVGNDHGLAIDNFSFSVTAVPEPEPWMLLMTGLAAVGFVARRRG
jgi:PEP-CTERM motif